MTNDFNFEKPLETAKDVSFVLLSNILIAIVIIIILMSIIYYTTQNESSDSYIDYLKNQFQFNFDFSFPKFNSNYKSSSFSKVSSYNDVYLAVFKYPTLLFITSLIFMILFALPKSNSFHDSAHISIPILSIFYIFILYKSFKTEYLDLNNFSLNRWKSFIIFFSVIGTLLTFYIKDPGNFVSNNFGESLLFIIIIGILVFMQLANILFKNTMDYNIPNSQARDHKNFAKYVSVILYVIFLITMIILITIKYKKSKQFIPIVFMFIFLSIIWGIFNYTIFNKGNNSKNNGSFIQPNKLSSIFGIFIGIAIFILSIIFLLKLFDDFSYKLSTFGKVTTILIIIILFITLYKFIKAKFRTNETKLDNFLDFIYDGILFIPCLVNDIFDLLYRFFYYLFTNEGKFSFYNQQDKISMLIIFFIVLFFVLYFSIKQLNNYIVSQNGNVLINNPVSLNKQYHLGNYETLNEISDYKYNYSISFWMYLHSNSSNNADQFYSILNYANKPNFLYNPNKHEFNVVCDVSGETGESQEILYKTDNIPLQKWINVIFTSNEGNMDIFIDNNLVTSKSNIIPYVSIDALTVGENDSINGGICNVIYFDEPLNFANMFILYYSNKYKKTPVTDISSKTIITSFQ